MTWHPSNTLYVDFDSGKYPVFRIKADADKGGQDRLLPMTREFAELIEPQRKESGFVFNPERVHNGRKSNHRRNTEWVSVIGSRIGEASNTVVSSAGAKLKYASFHDFRRSFGDRWAQKVMPQTLSSCVTSQSIRRFDSTLVTMRKKSRSKSGRNTSEATAFTLGHPHPVLHPHPAYFNRVLGSLHHPAQGFSDWPWFTHEVDSREPAQVMV